VRRASFRTPSINSKNIDLNHSLWSKKMSRTVLFSEMTPPTEIEADFNAWYDNEHIPLRMGAPGFHSAQRYKADDTKDYLAVYEMESSGVLQTPEYAVIKNQPSETTRSMLGAVSGFTRYIGTEIGSVTSMSPGEMLDAPILYAVFFDVPAERQADFDAWYATDHVPLLMEETQWLGVRRFEILDGAPERFNRMALHYLAGKGALESEARKKARATPWRAKLAEEPWFKGRYLIFSRLGQRQHAKGSAG
jgi:hypothetical protein